jgi:hypothetical protein
MCRLSQGEGLLGPKVGVEWRPLKGLGGIVADRYPALTCGLVSDVAARLRVVRLVGRGGIDCTRAGFGQSGYADQSRKRER